MNKGKNIVFIIALTLFAGALYTGCKKKKPVDNDTTTGSDNAIAEQVFDNVFLAVYANSDSSNSYKASCPTLSVPTSGTLTNTYPKTLTINYNGGCSSKKGYLVAYFSAPLHDSLSYVTVSYNNYFQSTYNVNASSYTITNKGRNNAGNYVFQVDISGGTLTGPITVASSSSSFECIKGSNTSSYKDDVFLIKGTRSGTSSNNDSYTTTIVTPLRVASNCNYIESGVLSVIPKDKKERVVNFGDANNPTCDGSAYVRIEDKYFNFTLTP